MRHINAESGLPREHSTGVSQEAEEEDGEEEEEEEEEEPWQRRRQHHSVLMGCSPPELRSQKVYQVSIFSPSAGSSQFPEQRAPGRQPLKHSCVEPPRMAEGGEWEAKRGLWGEGEDAIEDGLLVDGLALVGAAQHFSHSGLRVVEHRQEGRPSLRGTWEPSSAKGRGGTLSEPHMLCSILHTRDSAPVSGGDQPSMDSRQEENGGQLDKRTSSPQFLHDHDLHSLAHQSPLRELPLEPPAPSTPLGAQSLSTNGLSSAEKTPCLSTQTSGGGPASCPAKRKLLPSVEGTVEAGSEDESLPPARKRRAPLSPTVPASCRSTDAKGAPFWNHLLPAIQGSTNKSGACQLKMGLHLKPRRHLRSSLGRALAGSRSPTTSTSHALLGNFEESMLKGRFPPSGQIDGFTAEIGASGSYCPQHATLPVEVTYFDIAEHNAPSPFLGVIDLEALGKKGYSIPKMGTIQVTLFNPNKTVVKMFLVTYDFHDMPANHVTFLRHRIFLVPVGEEQSPSSDLGELPKRVLCYLMHLRFHSSKSGKIYLHDNIRLLFSRKSIEMDSGIPYELKSFTELPRNPCYSPKA